MRRNSLKLAKYKGEKMANLLSNTILSDYQDQLVSTAIPGQYFIPSFKTKDLFKLKTNAIQREHEKRVKKMGKHFDKRLSTQFNFSAVVCTTTFTGKYQGEIVEVSPGVDMLDGHTRRHYSKDAEAYPEDVTCMVYEVDNWEDYKNFYYSFDASEAAEKTNEKIVGACRALNIKLTSSTALGGGFGSALNIAYPGDRNDDILTKVAYFKTELEELDAIGLMKPTEKQMKAQCLMAAGLMALKIYGEPPETHARMIGGLQQLAKARKDAPFWSDPDNWFGMDAIAYQYLEQGDPDNWWVEKGYLRSTKFMSIAPQMDFIWYFFEKYMSKLKVKKGKGVKPSFFVGKFDEYQEALINIQPPQGYESNQEDN
jgi:hypothetical protein